MEGLAVQEVRIFLKHLGEVYDAPAALYLIGGGALCLLGNPRRTVDLDFALNYTEEMEELMVAMTSVADKLHIELEVIAFEEFVPLPKNAQSRHQYVGQFGQIEVYVFDPYTIALSKLARGLETDIQDVLFLLENSIIEIGVLETFVEEAIPVAWDHDVDPSDMKQYMREVRRLHGNGSR